MDNEEFDGLLSDLAKKVSPIKGEIGRIGTLYPGDPPNSFDPEDQMEEDNEAPSTDAEAEEHNRRTARELNPSHLSQEARDWLAAAMPPERRRRLRELALDRL